MGEIEAYEAIQSLYKDNGIVNLGKHRRLPFKQKSTRPSVNYLTDGGIPRGRLCLFAGEKSSGKSSFVIQLANILYNKILYIDTEYTLTTDYIEDLDCDPSKFDHAMPSTTEDVMNIIRENVSKYDCIIFDSINNSASVEQMQKEAGERTMANRANVFSSQLPIVVGEANKEGTSLFFISQVRQNMNKANKFSEDYVITGGESLHHNSSLTLVFKPSLKQKEKNSDELEAKYTIGGRMIKVSCTKNKTGKPFRTVEMEFTYGKGYTLEADIVAVAIKLGLVEKRGSWYKYGDISLGQGQDKVKDFLEDNPEMVSEILEKIEEKL